MLGLVDGDVLLHSSLWKTSNAKAAINNVNHKLEDWTLAAFCDASVIALGAFDHWNYRYQLFPEYKQSVSRSKGRGKRPEHEREVKEYIASLPNCTVADDIEADDLLGHWMTQLGDSAVTISVDKDLRQMPGRFLNPQKVINRVYTEEYSVVSSGEADDFFLLQMLMGDAIDNIPGVRGVGPIIAKRRLAAAESAAAVVVKSYAEAYGDHWEDYFMSNGKLLFIQREPNQHFTTKLFEEMFGVDTKGILEEEVKSDTKE